MRINKIWKELSMNNSSGAGFISRRYDAEIIPDVRVIYNPVTKMAGFSVELTRPYNFNDSLLNKFSDIQIDNLEYNNSHLLLIYLVNDAYRDIFSVFCEDLIRAVYKMEDENSVLTILFNRIEKWQHLFKKNKDKILNRNEQIGLFGELYFLKLLLKSSKDYNKVIKSWTSNDESIRDFVINNKGIEVKTITSKNTDILQINNERQLDESLFDSLYFFNLITDLNTDSDLTINSLIDEILLIIKSTPEVDLHFKHKLFLAGYNVEYQSEYDKLTFSVRKISCFEVYDGFPRIKENELREGVSNVNYSINIANLDTKYFTDIDKLMEDVSNET